MSTCNLSSSCGEMQALSPSIEKLLRGNELPLDAELEEIRTLAEDTRSILQDVERDMADARATLQRLAETHERTSRRLASLQSVTHPIRLLPNDILGEIFPLCFALADDKEAIHDALNPTYPPWTLSQVCRRWRDVSINLSSLWTNLALDFPAYKHVPVERQLERADLFLHRSGIRDLSLAIRSGGKSLHNHPLMYLALTTASRWRHFRADIGPLELYHFRPYSFERLLSIRLDNSDTTERVAAFVDAPALTSVHTTWPVLQIVQLPWAQLTRYSGSLRPIKQNLHLLQRVEDLAVTVSQQSTIADDVQLPSLTALRVTEMYDATPGSLAETLDHLLLPNIMVLDVTFNITVRSSFLRPLRGSTEHLTVLSLSSATLQNLIQPLVDFLSHTPNVLYLTLSQMALTDAVLRHLAVTSSHPILPCLAVLNVSACDIWRDVRDVFGEMMASRVEYSQHHNRRNGAGMVMNGQCGVSMQTVEPFEVVLPSKVSDAWMTPMPEWARFVCLGGHQYHDAGTV